MHLWNTRALIEELAVETMRESEKMKYLLAGTVIYLATGYFSVYPPPELNTLYFVEFALALGVTAFGITRCFKNNGGSEGKYFLERFACLAVPISIKCFLVFWVPYILFFRYTDPMEMGLSQDAAIQVMELVVFTTALGFLVLYYFLMSASFAKLRNSRIHLTTASRATS